MELMMSHLHAGPAVAARGADTAEVTFLIPGSVSAAAGPGGLTEIQPFETTDLDASEGGLPSTAFSLHVAVTWNARSVRMGPDGSPNDDRQHWFQRAECDRRKRGSRASDQMDWITAALRDVGGCRVSPVCRTARTLRFPRNKLWRNGRQRAAVAVKCATAPEGWRRSTVSPASVSQRRSSSTVPPAPKTPARRKARIARS